MKTEYTNDTKPGKIKALIIGDESQFSDINYILGMLKDFKCKHKDKFELIIMGWNGKRTNRDYMKNIPFTHIERTPFEKYFETIRHIGPDVLIIPATKSKFTDTSKNYIKYLEFAHMNIPVIAPNILPYSDLITNNTNGFLCSAKEDYAFQLETLYTEPSKASGTLGIAYATASDMNIAEECNILKLKSIYFPDYGSK
jgi:glycosyltransferase involved in cell wall biosynthesis